MMKKLMGAVALVAALHSAEAAQLKEARPGAKQYGNAEHGKEIVSMWCVSCHKAGPTADDRIPPLAALAARPKQTEGAIRAFLMQPHKPMPPLELSTQQIEDIIVYLRTFAPPAPSGR